MKTSTKRLATLAFLLFAAAAASAAPVVIGNKGLAAEKLDGPALKALFLGKKVSWDSGGRVVLAVLKDGPVAEDCLQKVAEMNSSSYKSYWRRLAMTGGGSAPKGFDSEADLVKFVATTPGAIGFVDSANADASVATLSTP